MSEAAALVRGAPPRDEVIGRLRAWLVARRPGLDPASVGDETDIIETRVLDSLQLVEFVLFVEDACGRSVLSEDLDPAHVRTLGNVYRHFFEAAP